jgi:hypothetical protein
MLAYFVKNSQAFLPFWGISRLKRVFEPFFGIFAAYYL